MIKFILYLIRWQLSTPILAITMLLLTNFNTWTSSILANLIGGCIFFFIDRLIFEKLSSNKTKEREMKEWFMFIFKHKIKIVHDAPRAEGCSESWQKLDELTLGTISPWGNTYYAYLHSKKYSLLYSVIGNRFILTPWQYKLIRAYKIKKSIKHEKDK